LKYPVTVTVPIPAGASVAVTPPSADGLYTPGTYVTVTATINPGFTDAGWIIDGDDYPPGPVGIAVFGPITVTKVLVPMGLATSLGAQPASGSGSGGNFQFIFQMPPVAPKAPVAPRAPSASLSVVNLLIGNFLDGRRACYLAYVVASSTLVLVDDA